MSTEPTMCADCGVAIPSSSNHRHSWHKRCRDCHIKSLGDDTPVRIWSRETGVTLKQLGEDTDVPYRTVQRAAAGQRIEYDAAERISQRTEIDIAILCKGVVDA